MRGSRPLPLDRQHDFGLVHHVTYNSLQMVTWLCMPAQAAAVGAAGGAWWSASLRLHLLAFVQDRNSAQRRRRPAHQVRPQRSGKVHMAHVVLGVANRDTAAAIRRPPRRPGDEHGSRSAFFPAVDTPRPDGPAPRTCGWPGSSPQRTALVLDALGQAAKRVNFHLDIMGDGSRPLRWPAAAGPQDWFAAGQVALPSARAYLSHDLFMLCSLRVPLLNHL
jgi:hypothetical protein